MSFFNFSDEISVPFPSGKEITFYRCDPAELQGKKFRPLTNSAGVSQALEIGAIKAATRNGLYTASVSPAQLLQYSDGSLSSIIKEGGRFSRHAGFLRANSAVFAPVVGMQILSFVTGQYFLVGLNRTLNEIRASLSRLENLDRASDWGLLRAHAETLSKLMADPCPSNDDLSVVASIDENCLAVSEKYVSLLSHKAVPSRIETHWWWSQKRTFEEFWAGVEEERIDGYICMVAAANFLAALSDIAYLNVLHTMNSPVEKFFFTADFADKALKFHQHQLASEVQRLYQGYINLGNRYQWSDLDVCNCLRQKLESWKQKISAVDTSPAMNLASYLSRPRVLLLHRDRWGRCKPFALEDVAGASA